ncbi:hypothetical protein GLOTRDRAFT_127830 [Gloeophyllum trabeum ATCC 11539]|uniref:Uncharacterized protein n=1 Tax=Gloeophyllum trabeum (strain ATCC 11539 / FP-39264 / Madison 617) TaxID=670483 RepID=S7RS86_GLOTA|nr:uncharacterized protein GLOTRDRAFT_127830 [Gloeophyllum trabeum ATCC 11539]EPQ57475.1 hypothetical protein GLOTRDRAFT_127830 [Gloeophyllum trabeum ATCC 11539]
MEGHMFVSRATQILIQKSHKKLGMQRNGLFEGDCGRFAMIFYRDGLPLVEPLGHGEEGILLPDIGLIDFGKNICDLVERYSQPDVSSSQYQA